MTQTRINSAASYYEIGHQAGRARKLNDESLAQFQTQHFYKMLALEPADYKGQCRSEFNAGYKNGRGLK